MRHLEPLTQDGSLLSIPAGGHKPEQVRSCLEGFSASPEDLEVLTDVLQVPS